jgi:hypothetical protein
LTIQGRQYHLQSWYELDEKATENHLQVLESIKELIDNELKLVDNASHIIIGGFRYLYSFFVYYKNDRKFLSSQGACLALLIGLTYTKQQLGGVICCSGQLIFENKIPELLSEYARKIPILVLHGKDDDRISWDKAKTGFELLKTNGIKDNMQVVLEDNVAHTISQRGFHLILMFIIKQFKL